MKKTVPIALASIALLAIATVLVVLMGREGPVDHASTPHNPRTDLPNGDKKTVYDDRQSRGTHPNRDDRRGKTIVAADGETNSARVVETSDWVDPINQKVLGPKKWMAEPSDVENEAIDAVFEKAQKNRDTRVNRESRQHSIEAMRTVVSGCLDEYRITHPDATGRIIVSWTATGGTDGVGKISDVTIDTNVGLRDAAFEACVRDGENLRFTSDVGDPLRVEYPFMFDEHDNDD